MVWSRKIFRSRNLCCKCTLCT